LPAPPPPAPKLEGSRASPPPPHALQAIAIAVTMMLERSERRALDMRATPFVAGEGVSRMPRAHA
jgi:hypothetical protein